MNTILKQKLRKINEYALYVFTVMLILGSIFQWVPALFKEEVEYRKLSGQLKSAKLEQYERNRRRSLGKITVTRLELHTDLAIRVTIDHGYSEYFPALKAKENVGKTFTFYWEKDNNNFFYNPDQIDIEGETIYDLSEQNKYIYFLIAMTIVLSFYSATKLKQKYNLR